MGQLDDLEKHVNELISELSEILQRLQNEIADEKAVSFGQVKVIENSIACMQKQGIPVPGELKALKIMLLSEHDLNQERIELSHKIQESFGRLLNQARQRGLRKTRIQNTHADGTPHRKTPNYKKPLGSKGYKNLEDYLIPVIRLMWSGLDHKAAFHKIAQKLDVRYNTVSAQCTRALDLTTEEFIRQVNSKVIVALLERKYSDQYQTIKTKLKG